MRPLLLIAIALALATPTQGALAQTMYKCVGADGKTSYLDQPCAGKVAAAKEIDVRATLADAEREAMVKAGKERLRREEAAFLARTHGVGEPRRGGTLTEYDRLRIATQARVKADEEARAEASRLWHCRRGKEPEKCI